MSVQHEQVASVLTRAVQEVLSRGINDPRVRGLLSVTRVEVSPDYADATIMVSVLPERDAATTMHGLHHAARHIRSEVGSMVRLRRMPRLSFKLDSSLKREAEILAAIDRARRDDDDRRPPPTSNHEEPAT